MSTLATLTSARRLIQNKFFPRYPREGEGGEQITDKRRIDDAIALRLNYALRTSKPMRLLPDASSASRRESQPVASTEPSQFYRTVSSSVSYGFRSSFTVTAPFAAVEFKLSRPSMTYRASCSRPKCVSRA
jgi:hypothetical protein